MKSEKTLDKYIQETFNLDKVKVKYTSSFTAEVEMPDGTLKIMALLDTVFVYMNDVLYQTFLLTYYGFKLII